MARLFGIGLVACVCLALGSATAAEPEPAPAFPRQVARAPEIRLPPRIQAICAKASGDLAFMCGEYERLYRETELKKIEASKKLQALTRGGVIEVLQ